MRMRSLLFAGVAACSADPDAVAAKDAGAPDVAPEAGRCERDARLLAPLDYVSTAVVAGACDAKQASDFGAACGADPSAKACATFLAGNPTCARCILGDARPGPLRRNTWRLPEVSPGTCAQAIARETYEDAGVDAAVGGCGKALENLGACVDYACAKCDANDLACRKDAYRFQCAGADELVPYCTRLDVARCVLGNPADRASAIVTAVCGPDAGS